VLTGWWKTLARDGWAGGLGILVPIARVNFARLQKFIAPLQEAAQRLSLTIAEEEGSEAGADHPVP
jgi:hypothetical protein